MKNIHLIPTDKPSRLFLNKVNNKLLLDSDTYCDLIRILPSSNYQNIYITNSEEIKEGDWCYDKVLNLIFQTDNHTDFKYANQTDNVLKIILTTDQDLIKDGVQSIDDEFLEWFVNDPSCETVCVIEEYKKCIRNNDGTDQNCIESINCQGWVFGEYKQPDKHDCEQRFVGYKIIIPQEEPNQETIEEAAEIFFDKRAKEEGFENWTQIIVQQEWEFIESFPVEFAKWQQGRRYSDEEMYSALQKLRLVFKSGVKKWQEDFEFDLDKWFEQFKKK